jgi:hypothetical protein
VTSGCGVALGADGYFPKPHCKKILGDTIRSVPKHVF